MDVWGYRLAHADSWRNRALFWAAACRPVLRAGHQAALITLLVTVLAGAVVAILQAQGGVSRGGAAQWVERKLENHDSQLQAGAQERAVIEERLRANYAYHLALDKIRIAEQLNTYETYFRLIFWLLGGIQFCLAAVVSELLVRILRRKK